MRRTSHQALGALVAATLLQFGSAAMAGERSWSAETAAQFKSAGLVPVSGRTYLQPLKLRQQTIVLDRSSAALGEGAAAETLVLGRDLVLDPASRQPERIAAPLFFLGSREPGPAMLHELSGKIVVMTERDAAAMDPASWLTLQRSGAEGFLTVGAPSPAPAAAAFLVEDAPTRFVAAVGAEAAQRLFARSGRAYAELAALAEAGRSLPSFDLNLTLRASLAIQVRNAESANVVGVVRGSDPMLGREYVVISAEAPGAQAVLDAARRVRQSGARPKRSVLFAVLAPENAQAFAAHLPVAREDIVASLSAASAPADLDATVAIEGGQETSLGAAALELAASAQLSVGPAAASARTGPTPYGFLEAGVPALRLTFGGSSARPDYLAALALRVADNDAHPVWMRGSRFAPRMPQAQELITAPVEMPLGRRPQRNLGDYARLDTIRLR